MWILKYVLTIVITQLLLFGEQSDHVLHLIPTFSGFEVASESNLRASLSKFGGKSDHMILYSLAMNWW